MFFWIGKFFDLFLSPVIFLLIWFLGYWKYSRKYRVGYWLIGFALVMGFGNKALFSQVAQAWDTPFIYIHHMPRYEVAVILGGFAGTEKYPHDRIYLNRASERIYQAISLYRHGKVGKLIVSGGNPFPDGSGRSDAEISQMIFWDCAVPREDFLLEDSSRTTYENALYTKRLLERHFPPGTQVVLVTSAFHMRRAVACFEKMGISVVPFAVDHRATPPSGALDYWLLPTSDTFFQWKYYFHEWVGYITYKLKGYC